MEDALELTLYKFESSWLKDPATRIEEFLPEQSEEGFVETLTELVRSDMEFRSQSDMEFGSNSYFDRFPQLADDPKSRKAVVFEEHRLRVSRGEQLDLEQFGRQFGVSFSSRLPLGSVSQTSGKDVEFPDVGETVCGFDLVGILGEGAFGQVFLAQQSELDDRLVVLKFTRASTVEHKLLARMQHTNIVPIHSVHRHGDLRAICMPLLGVSTLDDLLKLCRDERKDRTTTHSRALVQTVNRKREQTVARTINDGGFAEKFVARQKLLQQEPSATKDPTLATYAASIVHQIADGLGYAHQRGILHGDLKPANVLINDDGEAVLLDFHLGRATNDNLGGLIGGTLPYVSPEQLNAFDEPDEHVGPEADVYSTGVMLYELLTGTLPHDEAIDQAISREQLLAIKKRPFVISPDVRSAIGEDLSAIVETCLSANPKNRFSTGSELAMELERSQTHQPLRIAPQGSIANRFGKWAKRNPRLSSGSFVLAASSLVVLTLLTAFLLVNAQLNRVRAKEQSIARIDRAAAIQPHLATAYGFHDGSFFENAIKETQNCLVTNSWQDAQQFDHRDSLKYLDFDQTNQERLAAAKLHFWLAEVMQTLAKSQGEERLEAARLHNQTAQSLWPKSLSRKSLDYQQEIINGKPVSAVDIAILDNLHDELLVTYLSNTTDDQKELIYQRIAKQRKDDFLAWLMLANVCIVQDKPDQALAYYDVCNSLDSNSSLPPLYRAIVHLENKRADLAIPDLEVAERLAPNDVTVLLNHGLALGMTRQFEKALEKYDRAIELGAHQTRAWYLRSRIKAALGDKDGAAADLTAFMEMPPVDELSSISRGVRLVKSNPQKAIADFENALIYNPRSSKAYNNLAHVYSEIRGDSEKAIQCMDQTIEIDPGSADLWSSRAVLHSRLGKVQPALKDANHALKLDSSARIQYKIAGVYAQLSKKDDKFVGKAIQHLAIAAMQEPMTVLKLNRNDPDIEPISQTDEFSDVFRSIEIIRSLFGKKQ